MTFRGFVPLYNCISNLGCQGEVLFVLCKMFFVVCNRCFNEIKTGYPAKAATDLFLFLAMKKFRISWS